MGASPPNNEDLLGVLQRVYSDLEDALDDYGQEPDEGITACIELGGQERQLRLVFEVAPREPKPLTVEGFGMQLHAATTVDGADGAALERICRYLLLPPFAQDAIEALADGRVRIRFKTPMRGGRTHTDISRDTFLARLAALVPPPRFNLVRYYGVLANQHRLRKRLRPKQGHLEPRQLKLFEAKCSLDDSGHETFRFVREVGADQAARRPSRIAWVQLLARVFEIDVTRCERCGCRLQMVETVTSSERIAQLLAGARGPPPRGGPPGQMSLYERGV